MRLISYPVLWKSKAKAYTYISLASYNTCMRNETVQYPIYKLKGQVMM